MNNRLVIGVTGSLASGKTTAAEFFRQYGAEVVDVDRIGHELLKRHSACYRALRRVFGPQICTPAGEIDRAALAAAGFKNKTSYRRLCRIMHPGIGRRLTRAIAAFRKRSGAGVLVVDAAVLLEAGWYRQVDKVVLVITDAATRRRRLRRCGRLHIAQARQRLAFQWPDGRKRRYADYILDNRGTVTALRRQVLRLWQHWLDMRSGRYAPLLREKRNLPPKKHTGKGG